MINTPINQRAFCPAARQREVILQRTMQPEAYNFLDKLFNNGYGDACHFTVYASTSRAPKNFLSAG